MKKRKSNRISRTGRISIETMERLVRVAFKNVDPEFDSKEMEKNNLYKPFVKGLESLKKEVKNNEIGEGFLGKIKRNLPFGSGDYDPENAMNYITNYIVGDDIDEISKFNSQANDHINHFKEVWEETKNKINDDNIDAKELEQYEEMWENEKNHLDEYLNSNEPSINTNLDAFNDRVQDFDKTLAKDDKSLSGLSKKTVKSQVNKVKDGANVIIDTVDDQIDDLNSISDGCDEMINDIKELRQTISGEGSDDDDDEDDEDILGDMIDDEEDDDELPDEI